MKQSKKKVLKPSWHKNLKALAQPQCVTALQGIRRGIEKESLRVNADSNLAKTSHPPVLGSALTHAHITTDYAEAMMEFITPVGNDAQTTLDYLSDIHHHVYRHLGEELLWPFSMPCMVETEDDIELAQYGSSNTGKMKTLYRQGLKNRYGSMMQAISGIHYNFSMPDSFWPIWQEIKGDHQPLQDFISDSYLGLIRNFLRIGWLIPYLFGSSPAVDSSFLNATRRALPLKTMGKSTHYLPKATSLRMSSLGYNSQAQDDLFISYNSLHEFVGGLKQAVNQTNATFEKIGIKRHGEYRQLNTNALQSEGEFYAPIRPKRVTGASEKLSEALNSRGIEYVEVRSLDVNPYAETGIDLEQIRFLDVLLTHCLLSDSPALSRQQQQRTKQNLNKVATYGRDLSLQLVDDVNLKSLQAWGDEIFASLAQTGQLLDAAYGGKSFQAAVHNQQQKQVNPELTPSAKILKDMHEQQLEISELAMVLAKSHRRKLLADGWRQLQADEFAKEAVVSWQKQQAIEEADTLSFDDFLRLAATDSLATPPRRRNFRSVWPSLRNSTFGGLSHVDMFSQSFLGSRPTIVENSPINFTSDQANQV